MRTPTVHLNGTSSRELGRQLQEALTALDNADHALAQATPHGRDYYVQGDDAIVEAQAEHRARRLALDKIRNEVLAMLHAVIDQM